MQLADAGYIRGGGHCLDLLRRDAGVGGVEIQWVEEMLRRPLDELLNVLRHRCWRRSLDMLEDRVEDRARVSGEIGHKLGEFAVEVAEEQ